MRHQDLYSLTDNRFFLIDWNDDIPEEELVIIQQWMDLVQRKIGRVIQSRLGNIGQFPGMSETLANNGRRC